MNRIVEYTGRGLRIRFAFDRRLVEAGKTLPDRRWSPQEKVWTVPEDSVIEVVECLHGEGFAFDDEVQRLYAAAGGTRVLGGRNTSPSRGPTLFDSVTEDERGAVSPADYTVARLNREVRAVL